MSVTNPCVQEMFSMKTAMVMQIVKEQPSSLNFTRAMGKLDTRKLLFLNLVELASLSHGHTALYCLTQ